MKKQKNPAVGDTTAAVGDTTPTKTTSPKGSYSELLFIKSLGFSLDEIDAEAAQLIRRQPVLAEEPCLCAAIEQNLQYLIGYCCGVRLATPAMVRDALYSCEAIDEGVLIREIGVALGQRGLNLPTVLLHNETFFDIGALEFPVERREHRQMTLEKVGWRLH
jgi:hypothetical protein